MSSDQSYNFFPRAGTEIDAKVISSRKGKATRTLVKLTRDRCQDKRAISLRGSRC